MEENTQQEQEVPTRVKKLFQKPNMLAPYILSLLAVLLIHFPYFFLYVLSGVPVKYIHSSAEIFIATTVFSVIAVITIFWIWRIQSLVKYWILILLFVFGFLIEFFIVFTQTWYLDFFVFRLGQYKLCTEDWGKIVDETHFQTPDFPSKMKIFCERSDIFTFKVDEPSPTPSNAPSFSQIPLTPYTSLPKSSHIEQLTTLSDSNIKLKFSYPKKYYSRYFPPGEKGIPVMIFIVGKRDPEKEKNIDYVIQCELDNRKAPSGVCREGMMGDLEISISSVSKIPAYDEDQQNNYTRCEKEMTDTSKILYSCSTLLAPSPDYRGMRYILYLNSIKPIAISISTYDPLAYADVITSIIDSAEISR